MKAALFNPVRYGGKAPENLRPADELGFASRGAAELAHDLALNPDQSRERA